MVIYSRVLGRMVEGELISCVTRFFGDLYGQGQL